MRWLVLILAWITPAFIAGALGWSGIWGSGSALVDFLIPIPVAGGVLHLPSFLLAASTVLILENLSPARAQIVMLIALGTLMAALTLQIEFDRLAHWMFTDYEPPGSPIRFDGNPLLLFIATDAFWVCLFAFFSGLRLGPQLLTLVPVVPATIIGMSLVGYSIGGPKLTHGFSQPTLVQGNQTTLVHTTGGYDEALFRAWINEKYTLNLPWESVNLQNLSVQFTNSMQAIRWGKTDQTDAVVGTICFYESDQSSSAHRGYFDCFAGRLSLQQSIQESITKTDTGLGRDIDRWFAMARLCEGIEIPDQRTSEIELVNVCRGIKRRYPEFLDDIRTKHGQDSPQARFVDTNAELVGR